MAKKSGRSDLVLGIMSGTSLDGVDYGLCEIASADSGKASAAKFGGPRSGGGSTRINLIKLWSVGYPPVLKKRLMLAATNQATSYETAQLHHDLGRFYAENAPKVKCDYIGLHGQTIFHNADKKAPSTYQIGEPAYLAAKFNKPVVCQFRNMDLAFGGQGAPLATLFHKVAFSHPKMTVAVNNLGGISNVTYLPHSLETKRRPNANAIAKKILSFDTGPANILIDYAVEKLTGGRSSIDKDGEMASRGIASTRLVEKWLKHKFFNLKPPKSTGREDFGNDAFAKMFADCKNLRVNPTTSQEGTKGAKLSPYDIVATFTEFTAQSLALNYELHLPSFPDLVILGGGGAHNPELVKRIKYAVNAKTSKEIKVTISDALGWPSQAIETAAFALLAFQTMHNQPGNIPETTGAKNAIVLGQILSAPLLKP